LSLFEIYRRWAASVFTTHARLENRRGGPGLSRYDKDKTAVWRDTLLTHGIDSVSRWLADRHGIRGGRVRCFDVVVPTYRCDLPALARICALKATSSAAVHVLIIVDKPDTPNLQSLYELNSYEVRSSRGTLLTLAPATRARLTTAGCCLRHCLIIPQTRSRSFLSLGVRPTTRSACMPCLRTWA
jgi:hypothetical protein